MVYFVQPVSLRFLLSVLFSSKMDLAPLNSWCFISVGEAGSSEWYANTTLVAPTWNKKSSVHGIRYPSTVIGNNENIIDPWCRWYQVFASVSYGTSTHAGIHISRRTFFCLRAVQLFLFIALHENQECAKIVGGWGGTGSSNPPLPVPFNPGSRPVFVGSRLFAFFRLHNIAQCC